MESPRVGTTRDAEDRSGSSDEDAPEVAGTKSVAKEKRLPVKPPKRQKTKSKPSTVTDVPHKAERETPVNDHVVLSEQSAVFDTKPPADIPLSEPESEAIVRQSISNTSTSKRRKVFDDTAKGPKDVVQDGVIYRALPEDQPTVTVSKKHMFQLPPKSNTASRRQKEQMLVRKRVQHTWGGRSAFLRS